MHGPASAQPEMQTPLLPSLCSFSISEARPPPVGSDSPVVEFITVTRQSPLC